MHVPSFNKLNCNSWICYKFQIISGYFATRFHFSSYTCSLKAVVVT